MVAAKKEKYVQINIQAFIFKRVDRCSLLLILQMHLIILLLEMSLSTSKVYIIPSRSFQLVGMDAFAGF